MKIATCVLRPFFVIFPHLIFVGTIFSRLYRTTQIMWGKTPPDKIVTDGESIKNILLKVLIPQALICCVWMLAELPKIEVKRPFGRPWEQFSLCVYGSTGSIFIGVASAYILGMTMWSFYLLYTVRTSGKDPLYHNDSKHMSHALFVVAFAGAFGFAGALILDMLVTTYTFALTAKWLLISTSTPICAVVGLYTIVFPKYHSIYINPDENVIFPGKLFQQQVIENNKIRQVFPTEDESSIDPRVLRKNKELLLENLELLEVVRTLSAEKTQFDSTLSKYEEKRIERNDLFENSSQTSKYNLKQNPDDNVDVLTRFIKEIESSHSEASHYLGEMNKAVKLDAEHAKIIQSKKMKINKIIKKYVSEKRKRKTLQIASHNALPPLGTVLAYHNLAQYSQMFEKLKMTTSMLIQLDAGEIQMLPMLTGHQRKLQVAIKNLIGETPKPAATPTLPTFTDTPQDEAEETPSLRAILSRHKLEQFYEALRNYGCTAGTDLLVLSSEDLKK